MSDKRRGITHLEVLVTQPTEGTWRCQVNVTWIDAEGYEHSDRSEVYSNESAERCYLLAGGWLHDRWLVTS
jgi:hypothetical protein